MRSCLTTLIRSCFCFANQLALGQQLLQTTSSMLTCLHRTATVEPKTSVQNRPLDQSKSAAGCPYCQVLLSHNTQRKNGLTQTPFHSRCIESQMDSSRISLRPLRLSDADDFLTWASDDKVTRYLRWNSITSKEEALKYIQQVAIPHPFRHSICLDDRSIGYISVRPESGNDRHRAHVAYAVGSEYWGLGIATAAMKMAIPHVFEKFPFVVRLEALVEVENVGSQRVLEKVGFVKEGFLRKYGFNKGEIRDMLIYSFLKTDKIV